MVTEIGGERNPNSGYAIALARAFGGALLFALPLLMTMEMWWLGFSMDPLRLALFTLLVLPLLVGLSWISGFEPTVDWRDDVLDAIVAYAVGFTVSALVLLLVGVLARDTAFSEAVGMIGLQAVPASIGALLAQSQFGPERGQPSAEEQAQSYFSELFVMAVGALFLAFNLAPTEEIVIIAYNMTPWHVLGLSVLSIVVIHAFVYSLEFSGGHKRPEESGFGGILLRFGVVGYALALLISAYVLWTFGRLDGLALEQVVQAVVVLSFPAAVGAAAARLIL